MELSQMQRQNSSDTSYLRAWSMILKLDFEGRIAAVYNFQEMLLDPRVETASTQYDQWMIWLFTSPPRISLPSVSFRSKAASVT